MEQKQMIKIFNEIKKYAEDAKNIPINNPNGIMLCLNTIYGLVETVKDDLIKKNTKKNLKPIF